MTLGRRLPRLKPFLDYNRGNTDFRQIAAFDHGFLSSNRERMRIFRVVGMNWPRLMPTNRVVTNKHLAWLTAVAVVVLILVARRRILFQ
jgi:hypothetical protein